ncbi:MAG: TadE/TadG family type IV pilus assembly protein [Sphingorhabdus sp.]
MKRLRAFIADTAAGPAAEFALVLPLAIIFLFGIIDVGRLMWTWNRAEKATQMGVRHAIVTDHVVPDIANQNFVGVSGLTQGDRIGADKYGVTTCQKPAASVTCGCAGTCPWGATPTAASAPFTAIFNRMNAVMPELTADKIEVLYQPSGLGFAGDPNGADIAPIVTVKLKNLTFTPFLLQLFGGVITLPDFRASLTLEDGAGTTSN